MVLRAGYARHGSWFFVNLQSLMGAIPPSPPD